MGEILGYSELEVLVMVLMSGGVIVFLVGLFSPGTRSDGTELRGIKRTKVIIPLGIGLCTLGIVLGLVWNIF